MFCKCKDETDRIAHFVNNERVDQELKNDRFNQEIDDLSKTVKLLTTKVDLLSTEIQQLNLHTNRINDSGVGLFFISRFTKHYSNAVILYKLERLMAYLKLEVITTPESTKIVKKLAKR